MDISMNINASIIDQRITGIIETYKDWFHQADMSRKKSAAFILLCMSTCLEIPIEEAIYLFTDGGNDAGVDGIHIGDIEDGEFLATLFQGKYTIGDLQGNANFPENGLQKAINTVNILFDPYKNIVLNDKIAPKIEEICSLIRDAYLPTVRFILCNNGLSWNKQSEILIQEAKKKNMVTELNSFILIMTI